MTAPSFSISAAPAQAGQKTGASLQQLLPQQAKARLADLLRQLESQATSARKATSQLTIQIEQKMQEDLSRSAYTYGVFLVGKPQQRMVLRNVTELNGQKPIYTAQDFASAVQFVSQGLKDPVARDKSALNYNALLKEVQALAQEINHLIEVNAGLSGSGAEADPYVVKDKPLHVQGPITLGFPGVQPDQLVLKIRDGRLIALSDPATPS